MELLSALKAQDYQCWLVTNADCASLKLKLDNVPIKIFEVIVSSEQIGYAKEDIQFWKELQRLHHFAPESTIF